MANERARHLRRNRTDAERRLWRGLRELKCSGFKFRQQVPIDHFIVDLACLSRRLIIEVDGGTHGNEDELRRDAARERHLREQGFEIVRFWNADVASNLAGVLDTIVGALNPHPLPARGRGAKTAEPVRFQAGKPHESSDPRTRSLWLTTASHMPVANAAHAGAACADPTPAGTDRTAA